MHALSFLMNSYEIGYGKFQCFLALGLLNVGHFRHDYIFRALAIHCIQGTDHVSYIYSYCMNMELASPYSCSIYIT